VSAGAPATARLAGARRWVLGAAAALAACVATAALGSAGWPAGLAWTILLLVPLAAPLPGLLRGRRRTYAWATLCVAPYFVYGTMEVIANPAVRTAAGAILFASLGWFVALVRYLRLSRSGAAAPQPSAGT